MEGKVTQKKGAGCLYSRCSGSLLSALSWSFRASPRVDCFSVGGMDQSDASLRGRNAEDPMGSLDELRKSTLVDSRSNRYGKSFHLDSTLHFIESRGDKTRGRVVDPLCMRMPWHPYQLWVFVIRHCHIHCFYSVHS